MVNSIDPLNNFNAVNKRPAEIDPCQPEEEKHPVMAIFLI
jgi:hypothetical protein